MFLLFEDLLLSNFRRWPETASHPHKDSYLFYFLWVMIIVDCLVMYDEDRTGLWVKHRWEAASLISHPPLLLFFQPKITDLKEWSWGSVASLLVTHFHRWLMWLLSFKSVCWPEAENLRRKLTTHFNNNDRVVSRDWLVFKSYKIKMTFSCQWKWETRREKQEVLKANKDSGCSWLRERKR